MDNKHAKKLLDILIENTARIFRAGFGINYAESTLFSVIELISSSTGLKIYFLEQVAQTLSLNDPGCLDQGVIPQELIELVTHETRWDEMKNLAEKRVQDRFKGEWKNATGDISQKIIDALADNWPDREFYTFYQKKESVLAKT